MLDSIRLPSVLALAPDRDWLAALEARDASAFERLVREMAPRVTAVVRRLLDDPNDVDDAVAETFGQVFKKIGQFERGAQLSTWIHRIAVNCALLRLRSKRVRREVFSGDLTPRSGTAPDFETIAGGDEAADGAPEQAELRLVLLSSIANLPEKHRIVIELRDIERRSPEETAATLGISRNAVKIRLFRARRALKSALEHRFGSRLDDLIEPRRSLRAKTPWTLARRRPSLRATA
jgi:RNA polymerase sigma-70 factor (ECF subfamily)